jgi:hypothetical protein
LYGLDHCVGHLSPPIYPRARRGGLTGAGGISTDAKMAANIDGASGPQRRLDGFPGPPVVGWSIYNCTFRDFVYPEAADPRFRALISKGYVPSCVFR